MRLHYEETKISGSFHQFRFLLSIYPFDCRFELFLMQTFIVFYSTLTHSQHEISRVFGLLDSSCSSIEKSKHMFVWTTTYADPFFSISTKHWLNFFNWIFSFDSLRYADAVKDRPHFHYENQINRSHFYWLNHSHYAITENELNFWWCTGCHHWMLECMLCICLLFLPAEIERFSLTY